MTRGTQVAPPGPDTELLRVQELFHGLIRSRAREGGLPIPKRLPKLGRDMVGEGESRWFPVPGMYGGFAFRLQEREMALHLYVESWSRVAEGSELCHVVTAKEIRLDPTGL